MSLDPSHHTILTNCLVKLFDQLDPTHNLINLFG
jgi:hypothetical protein